MEDTLEPGVRFATRDHYYQDRRCSLRLTRQCWTASGEKLKHVDAPGALELEELVAYDESLLISDSRRAERKSNSHGTRACAQKRSVKPHLPFEPLSDLLSAQLLLIRLYIGLHVFPT